MRQMRRPVQPRDVLPSPRLRAFLGKRRNRRLLVLTSLLVFTAMLALGANVGRWNFITIALLFILGLLACVHGVLLNVGTQLIAAKRPADLDERQLSVWQRAHHRAYRLLVILSSALVFYVIILGRSLWLPASWQAWMVVVTALWVLVIILPSSVIYWTEPDVLVEPDR